MFPQETLIENESHPREQVEFVHEIYIGKDAEKWSVPRTAPVSTQLYLQSSTRVGIDGKWGTAVIFE